MKDATLGNLKGAGEIVSRPKPPDSRRYRGSFAFRTRDEAVVVELQSSHRPVTYQGAVDGEHASVSVTIVAVSISNGIAYLEG
jgi:hypothetical protein